VSSAHDHDWRELTDGLEALRISVSKSTAQQISSTTLRDSARDVVQTYFRRVRPHLQQIACDPELIATLDEQMQVLLRLANGRNRRSSYTQVLKRLKTVHSDLEVDREMRLGAELALDANSASRDRSEALILDTLKRLVPSAALSYEQALLDLADKSRLSYRGTANELRETVREVLDHIAPDDQVSAAPGFKLEKDRTKPTQKQKVRFVLKSRGIGESARKTPEDAASLIDELTASLTRSAYERGSVSAHISTAGQEVRQLKMYVDSVLAELLAVHAT
jgi:hypothetical protein